MTAECDRSFTRSDALAKHMRTVHEAEAIREATTKNQPSGPPSMSDATSADYNSVLEHYKASELERLGKKDAGPVVIPAFDDQDSSVTLDADEMRKSEPELSRYLKRKLGWAHELHGQLEQELEKVERLKKDLWTSKELLLEKVITKELGEEEASKIVH